MGRRQSVDDHVGEERNDTILGTTGAQSAFIAVLRADIAEMTGMELVHLTAKIQIGLGHGAKTVHGVGTELPNALQDQTQRLDLLPLICANSCFFQWMNPCSREVR